MKKPFEIDEYKNPIDRFSQLPEPTRRWLEQLREDDIADLNEALKFHHNTKTVGRFMKWLIITVVACFVVAAQFGEATLKLLGWIAKGLGGSR